MDPKEDFEAHEEEALLASENEKFLETLKESTKRFGAEKQIEDIEALKQAFESPPESEDEEDTPEA